MSGEEETGSVAARFAAGDTTAGEEVRARVRRIVSFRGYRIPHQERVDLEQAILLELWQAVGRPTFEPERFWGFVEVVTARRCIDALRARRFAAEREASPELEDPGAGPLARALAKERARLAEAALAELRPDCRELIDLHYRQRKSYAEIAAIVGRSEGSLRVRMHRCVQRASRILLKIAPDL